MRTIQPPAKSLWEYPLLDRSGNVLRRPIFALKIAPLHGDMDPHLKCRVPPLKLNLTLKLTLILTLPSDGILENSMWWETLESSRVNSSTSPSVRDGRLQSWIVPCWSQDNNPPVASRKCLAVIVNHCIIALVTLLAQANLTMVRYNIKTWEVTAIVPTDLCKKLKIVSNFWICLGVGIIIQ